METSSSITVLIIEDHEKVRAAMRAILEAADGIDVVGEAAEALRALELAEHQQADVLLLDFDLVAVTEEIDVGAFLGRFPRTRVIILTSYDDTGYARGCLEQGAAGCMLKEDVPGHLVQAVRTVQLDRHATWVSARLIHGASTDL